MIFSGGGFCARPLYGSDNVRIRTINTIKHGGTYYAPGVELELGDDAGRYFVGEGVVHPVSAPGEDALDLVDSGEDSDPVEELCQVDGVGKKIAAALVAAGVDTVDKLSEMPVDSLADIKGVSKARAEQILADAAQFIGEDDFDEESALDEGDYLGE